MQFYSVILRRKINIPDSKVKYIKKKGRLFAVGSYKVKGITKKAWRIIGLKKRRK